MSVLKLTVDETDTGNERSKVCAGGFDCAGGNLHGRPAQHRQRMGGIEAGCDICAPLGISAWLSAATYSPM